MTRIPPIRSRLTALFVALLLVVAVSAPTAAQEQDGDGEPGLAELTPTTPAPRAAAGPVATPATDRWFVELASPPTTDGTSPATVAAEHTDFQAEAADLPYQQRHSFDTLFNGLSIQVDPDLVDEVAALPSVRNVYPVEHIPLPETFEATPELATALAMTGADVAQTDLGLSGAGIAVAVMDTGIDYEHPDLGGCFGPFNPGQDCRVSHGFDFVGDDFNAAGPPEQQVPEPDDDPMDCFGHGTHVSGIVGADTADEDGATGVAPGVTFGAYKVFGCEGSTTADIMVAAMEMALADGMDVLNMSIGSAFQWPQYPTAQASDRLVDEGMVVVASIGNSGATGIYSAGAPGVGEKVIGTAAFDNTHTSFAVLTVSPEDTPLPYAPASGGPAVPTEGTLPMTRTGTAESTADACEPLAADLSGQAVLIRRGECAFHLKALHAQQAGAAAVVLYNNIPGPLTPSVAGTPPIEIPVVALSDTDGELIDARLAAGPVELTWTDEVVVAENPTAGLISAFSSYGPAPDLSLKPDIGAPGGFIRSTLPLAQGGYGTNSGTSMAAPHVAGAVALLLQEHPDTPAPQVRDILQNSAQPALWWGDPSLGFLDNVHRQGAGMLDIPAAVTAATQVTPAKLALGETRDTRPVVTNIRIHNGGDETVTYTLGHEPALSTGGDTFGPSFFTGFAEVEFLRGPVQLAPGQSATVPVVITLDPELPELSVYGGYLVVTGDNGETVNRVPYTAFKGDYQALPVLDNEPHGFPWLARPVAEDQADVCDVECFRFLPDGDTFTLAGDDVPHALVHLRHQVERLEVEVLDAADGSRLGHAVDIAFAPRSGGPEAFFDFVWDGTVASGDEQVDVPDGDYVLELTAGKALGEPDNPDHGESWTSPVVTIARAAGCDETLTGTQFGALTVAEGVTCLEAGTRVLGSVTVRPGAGLVATGVDVLGVVSAQDADVVALHGSRVAGAVTVRGATGSVAVSGNQVLGLLTIAGNRTGDAAIVISGNQVLGLLTCTGNQPPPVNDGTKNAVLGWKLGQCRQL